MSSVITIVARLSLLSKEIRIFGLDYQMAQRVQNEFFEMRWSMEEVISVSPRHPRAILKVSSSHPVSRSTGMEDKLFAEVNPILSYLESTYNVVNFNRNEEAAGSGIHMATLVWTLQKRR